MVVENLHPRYILSSKVVWLINTTVKEPASFSIDAEVDNFLFSYICASGYQGSAVDISRYVLKDIFVLIILTPFYIQCVLSREAIYQKAKSISKLWKMKQILK